MNNINCMFGRTKQFKKGRYNECPWCFHYGRSFTTRKNLKSKNEDIVCCYRVFGGVCRQSDVNKRVKMSKETILNLMVTGGFEYAL